MSRSNCRRSFAWCSRSCSWRCFCAATYLACVLVGADSLPCFYYVKLSWCSLAEWSSILASRAPIFTTTGYSRFPAPLLAPLALERADDAGCDDFCGVGFA